MSTAIFIRSYPKDFEWLGHCLNSIKKYCTGFDEVILTVPATALADVPDDFYDLTHAVVPVHEKTAGYVDQQITKLQAHHYTKSTHILYVDSDCIFHTHCTPDTFCTDDRPHLYMVAYADLPPDNISQCWKTITSRAIGFDVEYEYMRRLPSMYLRSTLVNIQHAFPGLLRYCCHLDVPNAFSEFNFIGAYLHKFEQENYELRDTSKVCPDPPVAKQYWSWGGISEQIQAEINDVLMEQHRSD